MSYMIIYKVQVFKSEQGIYTPFVLAGSNNSYDPHGGKLKTWGLMEYRYGNLQYPFVDNVQQYLKDFKTMLEIDIKENVQNPYDNAPYEKACENILYHLSVHLYRKRKDTMQAYLNVIKKAFENAVTVDEWYKMGGKIVCEYDEPYTLDYDYGNYEKEHKGYFEERGYLIPPFIAPVEVHSIKELKAVYYYINEWYGRNKEYLKEIKIYPYQIMMNLKGKPARLN